MESSIYIPQGSTTQEQWEDYMMHGIVSKETRREVLMSWQRCQEFGLLPERKKPIRILNDSEFQQLLKKNQLLIEISAPIIETVTRFIANSRFVIALCDANGIILKLSGNEKMRLAIRDGGFVEGADWSEQSAGSNAIGTSLAIKKPIQFCGYEHFCIFTQKTACSSAPIKAPDGRVIGIIDLTGRLKEVNIHTLGIAVAMASAIENCLRIAKAEKETALANAHTNAIIESITEGLIALDNDGLIIKINPAARRILNLPEDTVGKIIFDVFPQDNASFFQTLRRMQYFKDQELRIHTPKEVIRVLATIKPILNNNSCHGKVLVISELKRARQLARKFYNVSAKLTFSNLIGESPEFKKILTNMRTAAHKDSTILLLGESGTGKDVCAQAIHNESDRRHGPFVAINCGAIPKELMASELFGYVNGAFTGANRQGNLGKFELADDGTLFLDEISELPYEQQVYLLRVLESRTLTRVGGHETIPIDVRIIAASNKNLEEHVKAGFFRQDLFYRLNIITFNVPPLRERKEDIPLLVKYFMSQFPAASGDIPQDYLKSLMNYSWPGNIRELRNIIERTISLSPDGHLSTAYLPSNITSSAGSPDVSRETAGIQNMESDLIRKLIQTHNGNLTKVASELGVARTTLYRKMRKYHIDKDLQ